jgi:mannose-6-phosphate isomerase-like protein (cupin superfamily)/type 1 glutamine amidotransferase
LEKPVNGWEYEKMQTEQTRYPGTRHRDHFLASQSLRRGLYERFVCASLVTLLAVSIVLPARAAQTGNKVVLIGGDGVYEVGKHDWPHGIDVMVELLENSPQVTGDGKLYVESHPYGWPSDDAFDDAATIVFYFSGTSKHPMLDPKKRALISKLMDEGVGLVAYHQSFTLPEDDTSVPMAEWLGAVRYGKYDRTTAPVLLEVASGSNPVLNGLEPFVMQDEYYPTLQFNSERGKVSSVWNAEMPVHTLKGERTVSIKPMEYVVAWAYERENGGRSFAFSGAHFLENWDREQMRVSFLNAVLWTAGRNVPASGAVTTAANDAARLLEDPGRAQPVIKGAVVTRPDDNELIELPWGEIEWYVSGALRNSTTLTVGQATVFPGKANPVHFHPNCDEVLHVLSGRILHTMDDVTVEMSAGDTVSIPKGVRHNATNIGDEDAKLAISFSTAWREVVGE